MGVISFRATKDERKVLKERTAKLGYLSISEYLRGTLGFETKIQEMAFAQEVDEISTFDTVAKVLFQVLARFDDAMVTLNAIAKEHGVQVKEPRYAIKDPETGTLTVEFKPRKEPEAPVPLPTGFDR